MRLSLSLGDSDKGDSRQDLIGLQTCAEVWGAGSSATSCGSGSPVVRTSNQWDALGRLQGETQSVSGQTHTVGYGYDGANNRTRISWPDGWRALYQFDALNRMEQVGPDANADGAMDSVFSLFAYDPQSRLTDINRGSAAFGTGVTTTDIDWEVDGDLDRLTHAFNGETSVWDYGYDRSAKLTSEDKPVAYSYVPAAARTISYSLGASGSNTEKLDQYVAVGAGQATYDQNGNRTSMGGLTTNHDSENRLSSAVSGSMNVFYIYDAAGRRVMKDFGLGGAVFYFHPDRLGTLAAITDGARAGHGSGRCEVCRSSPPFIPPSSITQPRWHTQLPISFQENRAFTLVEWRELCVA